MDESQDATAPDTPESPPGVEVTGEQLMDMYEVESERSSVLMEQIARLSAEVAQLRVLLKKAKSESSPL